ncbi:MAG: aminomethyl-transferring glycine dehydrogenase subunit GcvPB [Candidatus Eremiobacter antarcticus]|nr:aminomethyl-transferring glycine dehydrogenase subunit GcvPB [Candidatus Eremiobacteraeota bacterium]MBC5807174.1 aminomethyl-transferring glycine dehydrogenase subunit GcvPB [Candidatus Eremiobacteraeota bacterium]PZR61000.1 MAG: aminomethyl-transferring glycine dehydrogenase subunit GcvPB [Candidatus Eremiobacter sp. RRmetagenome_bin22]
MPSLLFERGAPGRGATFVSDAGAAARYLDAGLLRADLPLPDLAELEVARHFTELSSRNFSVDRNFYPLGSCTMKYNPKLNEAAAAFEGFTELHPFAPDAGCQGALQLLWRMQRALTALFGMTQFSLMPAAGAHGEITAMLMAKKHFNDIGEGARNVCLVPDTAHGTNPASAAMVGYRVNAIASTARGRIDVAALKRKLGADTAVCMMTNPNTLGLFEDDIVDVTNAVHEAGGLMYYDGANANAIVGLCRPGDMGFDLLHLNLHKTFSVPHGGGGPGSGPVGANKKLAPYLPQPLVIERDGAFALDWGSQRSIGPVRAFWSHFLAVVRAYAYVIVHGVDGLRRNSELAVLNANYVRAAVKDVLAVPYEDFCRHEFVCSAEALKKKTGVRALDLAKGLLDAGIHAPTMYWPHVVPECLMIEPTETETKATLDGFAATLRGLVELAEAEPDALRAMPLHTSVRRVDEAHVGRQANKGIGLRWSAEQGAV